MSETENQLHDTGAPPAATASTGAYVARLTGATFRCDDGGTALVVNQPTEPIDALIDLVVYAYGGTWDRSNPVLVAASAQVRTEVWHSCTKRWREDMGVDDRYVDTWWSPDGDGARQVLVAFYPDDLYDLGKAASDDTSMTGASS